MVVAKPGKVTQADALELLRQAEAESDARILARGRTYARAGQVVSVVGEAGRFSARIQGTTAKPYRVVLERTMISGTDRIAATCSCPYGCDYDWCKHACALAYVAAFLLERDATMRATWLSDPHAIGPGESEWRGSEGGRGGAGHDEPAVPIAEDVLVALLRPPPVVDVAVMLAAASMIVPHPVWSAEREAGADDGQSRRGEDGSGSEL